MNYSELMTKRLLTTDMWKIPVEGETAFIDISECSRIESKSGVEYLIGDKVTSNANLVKIIDIAKAGGIAGVKVTRVEYKGYITLAAYPTQVEFLKAIELEQAEANKAE